MIEFADRYVTVADPLATFDEAIAEVAGLLLVAETVVVTDPVVPLDNWTFDRLRHHFVEILDEFAALAEGDGADAAPDRGPDVWAAFTAASTRARKAFRRPGYVGERAMTPLGLQPGSVTVQHVVNELVSHAWDLARCVDRRVKVPEWLLERCRLSWQVFFETYGRPDFNFAPEKPVPADASAADRLAAYLGRTV